MYEFGFEINIRKRKYSLNGCCFSCPICLTRLRIRTNYFLIEKT